MITRNLFLITLPKTTPNDPQTKRQSPLWYSIRNKILTDQRIPFTYHLNLNSFIYITESIQQQMANRHICHYKPESAKFNKNTGTVLAI